MHRSFSSTDPGDAAAAPKAPAQAPPSHRRSEPAAPLYLASRSPRRLELLAQLGLSAQVIAADVDETPGSGESPSAYVQRIAAAKARAGWAGLAATPARPVLAADTAVVIDDQALGKPANAEDAVAMLALLSQRTHAVLTAVTVLVPDREDAGAPTQHQVVSRTEVRMRAITPQEARAYWASGEPRDKAGAYAVQGRGAVFVEWLNGSYSNVVGLPLFETAALLREQGIEVLTP